MDDQANTIEDSWVTASSSDMSPLEKFRTDPIFRRLKKRVMENPSQLCTAIKRLSELDPEVMYDIDGNQADFLAMLIETEDFKNE